MKEKQCGINITEHVLQLQRVITWYRNVRYREVSLYELHPFFLSWVETILATSRLY